MSKIEQEAFAWVARKCARGLSDADITQRDAWLAADTRHQGAYVRAMAIYNAINLATVPATDPLPESPRDPLFISRRGLLIYGGMAACLAATVGTFRLSSPRQERVLATAKGEFRKVPLQDKSVATINSGSRIEVDFTSRQRKIKLRQGEAWFEVAKDKSKPFIVESGQASIRAVGTAFSVRRFEEGTEVLVTEGTVEVWSGDGKAQRRQLVAGERAFLAQAAGDIAVSRQPTEVNRKLAWREGKLILKNQTLSEAVADFNRYSPKTIVIVDERLRAKRLFGQYQLDAPELFAKDVSTVLDVPLRITADTIFIG
jgi:transmembrane sensor